MPDEGFVAIGKELNWEEYAIFSYQFETPIEPLEAAVHLCQEQSTALWNRVGVKEDFREKHGAKVIELTKISESKEPSLKLSVAPSGEKYTTVKVKIAHPTINFGAKLPNLITAACGEGAFFSPGINTIKLIDVILPKKYLKEFEGPKFGIEGIRKKLNAYDRPVFLGVVKPNVGLKPKDFAELAYQAYLGGLDIAKDDEMLADTEYSPAIERAEAVLEKMFQAEDKTGEKKMYLVNITDEVDRLWELHDKLTEMGVNALMLNAFCVGISAARMLAKKTKAPLFSHFDFISTFSRIPTYGVSSELVTKIQRLAGFDGIIMPGFGSRMLSTEQEVKNNAKACLYEMDKIKKIFPIPGGSDWAGSVQPMKEKLQTNDFGMVPGRGIFGHPLGPEGGAKSMRQAWEAIEKGLTIEEYAKTHIELAKAIEAFGKK